MSSTLINITEKNVIMVSNLDLGKMEIMAIGGRYYLIFSLFKISFLTVSYHFIQLLLYSTSATIQLYMLFKPLI